MSRVNSSVLWDFFEKHEDKKARCVLCRELYSYKSTTGNLKRHLKANHTEAYLLVSATQEQQRTESMSTCESNSESHPQISDLKEQLREKHPELFDSDKDNTGDDENLKKKKYTITKNGTKEILVEKKPENAESGDEEEWIEGEFKDCVRGDENEDSSDEGGKVFKAKRIKANFKTKIRRSSIINNKTNEEQDQEGNIRFGQFVAAELGKFKGKRRSIVIQKIMRDLLDT